MWTFFIQPKILTYYIICHNLLNSVLAEKEFKLTLKNVIDAVVMVGLPVFSYLLLKTNSNILDQEEFEIKFGSLYGNLNKDKSSTISFTSLFCLHRIVIAFASVFLQTTSVGSTIPYLVCSIVYSSLMFSQMPMKTSLLNLLERLN